MKLIVKFSDTGTAECEGDTEQELVRQAAFWHSLPVLCPVDDTPVRFGYKLAQGIEFYCLYSTGTPVYEFGLGNGKGERGMMAGKVDQKDQQFHQRWVYYDHDKKREVVVWEDGRLLIEKPSSTQPVKQAKPVVQASTVEHRNITDPSQLDGVLEEAERFEDIPSARAGLVTGEQMDAINQMGIACYGSKQRWETKVRGLVGWASNNEQTDLIKLKSEDGEALFDALEDKIAEQYQAKAQQLKKSGVKYQSVDPITLKGLSLAVAYVALCEAEGVKVAA